ncbi:MAG: tungsten ABC transporter substrate-binding protein, partial [Burkholderiales bacterium]
SELHAYTLTDRATQSALAGKTRLEIMVQGDPALFNSYGIIAVNPAKYPDVNYTGAMALIDWITSAQGQQAIAQFKINGEQLFFPGTK